MNTKYLNFFIVIIYFIVSLIIQPTFSYVNASIKINLNDSLESDHIMSDSAEAETELAVALERKGDYREAYQHYERALEFDPLSGLCHYNLAALLHKFYKDYTGAKEHYLKAIDLNSELYAAHFNLFVLLDEIFNDYEGAKEHYVKAISLKPDLRSEKEDKYFGIK